MARSGLGRRMRRMRLVCFRLPVACPLLAHCLLLIAYCLLPAYYLLVYESVGLEIFD